MIPTQMIRFFLEYTWSLEKCVRHCLSETLGEVNLRKLIFFNLFLLITTKLILICYDKLKKIIPVGGEFTLSKTPPHVVYKETKQ